MSIIEIDQAAEDKKFLQKYEEPLSDEEVMRARKLNMELSIWTLAHQNLDFHTRSMFMYTRAQGKIGSAVLVLMNEFIRPGSNIPPTEPPKWLEWAGYWQRGFDTMKNERVEPTPTTTE